MKKLISILLILSIITVGIVGNALADDFSVRNGIHFGMTVDEVKALEKNNGVAEEDIYLDKFNGDYYCVGLNTSIAGIDDSRLLYQFDPETNLLVEFRYMLGPYKISKDLAWEYFQTVLQSLMDKYGEPLHSSTTDGAIFPIVSETMQGAALDFNVTYYEWLVDFGDYYILIDAYNGDSGYGSTGSYVGYKYVSKEDAEKAIQNLIDEQNEKEKRTEEETNRDL